MEQPDNDRALFIIRDSEGTRVMYPDAFRLSLTYTPTADGLHMDYLLKNQDSKSFYYEIGAHPRFNCPLCEGERFEDYVLEFEKEETAESMVYGAVHMQFDVNRKKPMPDHSNVLPLSYEPFVDDAIFFDGIKSRKVAVKNSVTNRGMEVDYWDFETIAIWTAMPSKGPFVCVEQSNGSAIQSDEDDKLKNRHFIQSPEVGVKKWYHWGIRVL